MQFNVRRLGITAFLFLTSIFSISLFAQTPTSGDVMRDKITKVKALVALRNYSAAIYELEGIRRETNDLTVTSVVQVMLINCYLEQNDYARAQKFLEETFNNQKAGKANANYYQIAAQTVKSARNQIDRYKSLGLMVSDRNLPAIAAADVDKMRETIEVVITQSKALGADKKQVSDAMALLEEAIVVRSGLARDDYDAKRWKEEVADARESLMNSRSQIVNAVDDQPVSTNGAIALNNSQTTTPTNTAIVPVSNSTAANGVAAAPKNETAIVLNKEAPKTDNAVVNTVKPDASTVAVNKPDAAKEEAKKAESNSPIDNGNKATATAQNSPTRSRLANANAPTNLPETTPNAASASSDKPVEVGSLVAYATERVSPNYPPAAKTIRMTGTVRVELEMDETGKVAVKNTSGPSMLQRAAVDALKKWKFKPVVRDGQPVRATGFVSFNFNL